MESTGNVVGLLSNEVVGFIHFTNGLTNVDE